jgi:hypothetical protein
MQGEPPKDEVLNPQGHPDFDLHLAYEDNMPMREKIASLIKIRELQWGGCGAGETATEC